MAQVCIGGCGDMSGGRLEAFQRNVAFAAFIGVICLAGFFYLMEFLREVLAPLIWALFFALPLNAAVMKLNDYSIHLLSCCCRPFRGRITVQDEVSFLHNPGENTIMVENTVENARWVQRVNDPLINCRECRRPYTAKCCCLPRVKLALRCCKRRIRIKSVQQPSSSAVNCLQPNHLYYLTNESTDEQEPYLTLGLYVDENCAYPAVVPRKTSGADLAAGSDED
eukprot:CAMPEP_0204309660 /NCGR_PEP_ID=MMETSP0469-20131031/1229_1 /ASSEMBLY_ACC=CAM_ASM_000384 /TAXON_ID=2969 /ORGANISM="Oxyrrhis marina" /LENGTH=223 /DNA_ID=CAMNT_0051289307 /DNA_START=57 /DNA_END=725 /DNA_ORIENTATION=-